jgi:hypothetical protein
MLSSRRFWLGLAGAILVSYLMRTASKGGHRNEVNFYAVVSLVIVGPILAWILYRDFKHQGKSEEARLRAALVMVVFWGTALALLWILSRTGSQRPY